MNQKSGFTLIELSIVLVIIGLIVGGVLVGRDLVHASELRSVMKDLESYKTAYNAFRLKYNCLPADCTTASSFFTATNGDGDGYICTGGPDIFNSCSYQFWYHLSQANFINGSYSGTGSTYYPSIGTNIPSVSALGAAVGMGAGSSSSPANGATWGNVGNYIWLGTNLPPDGGAGGGPSNGNKFYGTAVNAMDARNIDIKMDDGKAKSGRIFGEGTSNFGPPYNIFCTTGTNMYSPLPNTGDYDMTTNYVACRLFYKLD